MVDVVFKNDASEYGSDIRDLLALTEDEFHPPLASREGTTQTAGLDEQRNDALDDYYEQCMEQLFVLVLEEGSGVTGLLSFRQSYETDALDGYNPSNYVSTIIVHPDHRRRGHAERMYHKLLNDVPDSVRDPYVTTRTWSTNDSHLSLLEELGFENVSTIRDDRGEGVHTVYYGIPVESYSED